MATELTVPSAGESITEIQIGRWLKSEGERVERDEPIVELETDKASMELPSPVSGVLTRIVKHDGETARVGEVIGHIEAAEVKPTPSTKAQTPPPPARMPPAPTEDASERLLSGVQRMPAPAARTTRPEQRQAPPPAAAAKRGAEGPQPVSATPAPQPQPPPPVVPPEPEEPPSIEIRPRIMPAARRALAEHNLSPTDVVGTGPGGRVMLSDVEHFLAAERDKSVQQPQAPAQERPQPAALEPREPAAPTPAPMPAGPPIRPVPQGGAAPPALTSGAREDQVVPMTLLRRRIAERLVDAQQHSALLTTFNEVDMSAVAALRESYGEAFQKQHGVKLGLMSFFVKATVAALKRIPGLNAEIRENEIVYHQYYDIGVAVSTDRGLVVPVLRDAQRMDFAAIESRIADLAGRARDNRLKIEELQGGTFTITNGGVFGSLLSTPIINPPQSGILGLHTIQDRPVARSGEVVIRPMMYIALTYDHRLVDGREAVTFLRHVKELIEEPGRMLIEG
jgi:2-oxoglutarate dehydrogenase E2 component (dihydrolipoamide succinyltransferase)